MLKTYLTRQLPPANVIGGAEGTSADDAQPAKECAALAPESDQSVLMEAAVTAAVATDFEHARHEFRAVSIVHCGAQCPNLRCVCHKKISYGYVLRDPLTGALLGPIGSTCIRHFDNDGLIDSCRDLRDLQALKSASDKLDAADPLEVRGTAYTRRSIHTLRDFGVIDAEEETLLLEAFNSRKPKPELSAHAREVSEKTVRPWLSAWDGTVSIN